MAQAKDVFRPTIDSDQIYALLDIMDAARRGEQLAGLNPTLKSYYEKLRVQAFKIGDGIARPAYVATGVRKEPAVNMNSLGVTEEEQKQYNNSPDLSDDASKEVESYELKLKLKDFMEGSKTAALEFSAAEIVLLQNESKLPASLNEGAIRAALAVSIAGMPASLAGMLTESAEKTIAAFTGAGTVNITPDVPTIPANSATGFTVDEFGNILSPESVDKNKGMFDNLFGKL